MSKQTSPSEGDDDKYFLFFMQGNEKGLQYFMKLWHEEMSIHAKKILADDFEIRTVIQDAFLNVWAHRSDINNTTHLFYYIRQQIRWLCYGAIRKLKKQQTVALEPYEYQLMETYDSAAVIEQHQHMQTREELLEQAITCLPRDMEIVVNLWKKGLSPDRIAQMQYTSSQYIVSEIRKSIAYLKRIQYRLEKAAIVTARRPQLELSDYKVYLNSQQAQIFSLYYERTCSLQQIADLLNLSLFQLQKQHAYIKQVIANKPQII
ncbi:hypothetical protein A8C56_08405 [Niabella ginsenosidivorans]|uniref:RNA polymerase sigma-70 region 2 domain-containing protein n=1 Tax=Niabella ginsenosidivorans TaxID=1176587 RepID=A0A1A9I011_9BACT|nr:sigma-70 family RNA polymerase sigma factor [Niabella ginsenosidivorans]ANH80997.1 hypothetical protein A8C56_08405 [Niabella ginsenosidivorans]